MALEGRDELVVVEPASPVIRRAGAGLALLGLGGGVWLIYLVSLLHGSIALPALTLAGVLLVDAAAGGIVWWHTQQAEYEAAQSGLRLEHAAAAVRVDDPSGECTLIIED